MSNEIFARMRPSRPPNELKMRVLRAARSAATAGAEVRPDGWGFSRYDLAWAAALLLLLACHAGLSLKGSSVERSARSEGRDTSDRVADKELARQAGIAEFGRIERLADEQTSPTTTVEQVLRVGS